MADEQLKQLVTQGLSALKAGGKVAAGATAEIENDASDEGLKQALRQGNDTSKQWMERIDRALQEAGGGSTSPSSCRAPRSSARCGPP